LDLSDELLSSQYLRLLSPWRSVSRLHRQHVSETSDLDSYCSLYWH